MKNKGFRIFAVCVIFSVVLSFSGDSFAANSSRAKNIILLIADGMGMSHFRAAQLFSERVMKKELRLVSVMRSFRAGHVINDTADSTVTESAAAAGQIATGELMTAKAISMAADGKTPVRTILEIAKNKGMAIGMVTTSGITDATPAGFSAHSPSRYDENEIAAQQIALAPDVLMGGRKKFFIPENAGGKREDGRDLIAEAARSGYAVVETAAGLRAAPDKGKILGLFNMNNMNYEIDRSNSAEPSLAEMTEKTLRVLSKNKKGFFAMIEGGRIDHASHDNDVAAMIRDVIAFDEAVGVAVDFAEKTPGTLVIITSDHETGGFSIIGCGKESDAYIGVDLAAIDKLKSSQYEIAKKIKKDPRPETVMALVKEYASITLTTDEAQIVASDALKNMDPHNYRYDYSHSLAFALRPYLRIGWASQTHTATPIFIFAKGPGSEGVNGLMHNTEIFDLIKKAMGAK